MMAFLGMTPFGSLLLGSLASRIGVQTALGKLYTRQEQWVPLCTILLNEADASSDAALRAAAHARIARLLCDEILSMFQ